MRSITQAVTITYEVQKSKFLCFLFPVMDIESVNTHFAEIHNRYSDATHHCYAYIINNAKRCSDDGEPSGTAGIPILNVLEKQGLNFILCIVVRYFGGILLGAGGLVRAYTSAVTSCLNHATYVDVVEGKEILLTFSYEHKKIIDIILKGTKLVNVTYQEYVTYHIEIANTDWETILKQLLPYLQNYQLLKDCYCNIIKTS